MRAHDARGFGRLALIFVLASALAAPLAFAPSASAQETTSTPPKKKKKKKKPAAPAPEPAEAESAPPTVAPEPPPPPAPAEPAPAPASEHESEFAHKEPKGSESGPYLRGHTGRETYIGLRYRGNIVPKFMVNLFVDEGTGLYSNQIGIEYEMRHDGFSLIPWLMFATYGFGDTLFLQKGKPQTEQYYSDINSSMNALYAGVDLLWSAPISDKIDFEYGGGAGLGFVFGALGDNWVFAEANGPLVAASGAHYAPCTTTGTSNTDPNYGCNPANHQNATTYKVGGFQDSSWFGGGPKPVIFPYFAPNIGLRFRVADPVVLRATLGFGLTGPFLGIGGSYELL